MIYLLFLIAYAAVFAGYLISYAAKSEIKNIEYFSQLKTILLAR